MNVRDGVGPFCRCTRGLPLCCLLAAALLPSGGAAAAAPNVLLLVADDLGYGDLGCYGAQGLKTPNLDRLAQEGVRLSNFYSAASVCSASRAALWTGCYPCRVGLAGDLGAESEEGLAPERVTLAELAKAIGYRTALFGKWHLGSRAEFLPARQGFDQFYGIPFSHNLRPLHSPEGPSLHPNLPIYDGDLLVGHNPDMAHFTADLTERAVDFIRDNAERRFLLCVAYPMPEVPLAVSEKFAGTTGRGLFGDVVAELDWSVGEILAALAGAGLDTETLVVFTSDNGPALEYGDQAGSAGGLRGGKGSTFEGGMRVPCLVRWTGKIPSAIVSDELVANFDLLPTVARQIGADLPPETNLDGRDIWPVLTLPTAATSPHKYFCYYSGGALHAIRSGRWKLHFPHGYVALSDTPASEGEPIPTTWERIGLSLFDLDEDPGETRNLAKENEKVVLYLGGLAEAARQDLGDSHTRRQR
ncbi:MAG: sulfatase [Planctomycetaceae bacterium]|nr:sulfatase [Planctomycetaceae bacterium]